MAKKYKSETGPVAPVKGWILITREELDGRKMGNWYVCWEETFALKTKALAFAKNNGWRRPYRAVRGRIAVDC